jgi:hypothetical protein
MPRGKEFNMRFIATVILAPLAGMAAAKLPPPSAEAKALSAETAAKAAPAPTTTAACVDPGPYVSQNPITPATSKSLEASGAHSPPGAAISPPSTNKTDAEISKSRKP